MDRPDFHVNIWPSYTNIVSERRPSDSKDLISPFQVRELDILVSDMRAGDRRFLFGELNGSRPIRLRPNFGSLSVAAHGTQIVNTTDTELDGMDEGIHFRHTFFGRLIFDRPFPSYCNPRNIRTLSEAERQRKRPFLSSETG